MPPKFSELKVLSDADRRKLQKQRDAEKKQSDAENQEKAFKTKIAVSVISFIVIVIVLTVIYFSMNRRTEEIQQKQAKQIEMKFPAGEIFKFDFNTKIWEKPSTRSVEEGGGIRTGNGGCITLVLSKNRQMKMFDNSEVMFNKITPNPDNLDFLNVSAFFVKGSANFEIGPGPCSLNVDTDILTVKMPENFAALFKMQYKKKDKVEFIRIAVKSGRVQVLNKKTKSVYDLESLNEMTIDRNSQITGPTRFPASSEVF
ncbi:MAG TPA: hypothetical protein PKW98_09420 [Candidatus Wallbacteria bacterium]|nr:MAG: hypothetical protein BWY32_03123 [bacterium ADurb.Bin243]HOD41606.1 hypothetical protein [Candidatus Wallbacteria bacterium]HPG58027.1 hypothetical protein [Candidatus Wallbacteria bacterium]